MRQRIQVRILAQSLVIDGFLCDNVKTKVASNITMLVVKTTDDRDDSFSTFLVPLGDCGTVAYRTLSKVQNGPSAQPGNNHPSLDCCYSHPPSPTWRDPRDPVARAPEPSLYLCYASLRLKFYL